MLAVSVCGTFASSTGCSSPRETVGAVDRLERTAETFAEDDELVAAEPGERVPGLVSAASLGASAASTSPRWVSERVVDHLEAVEVEQDHRDELVAGDRRRQAVEQQGAVEEASERIVHRLVGEFVRSRLWAVMSRY